jgi:hypothetical protein
MVSIREIGKGFSLLSAGVIHLFIIGVGLLIHVWTIVIAFSIKGLFAAAITLACPVLSEIYWAFILWKKTDSISNSYTISLFIYVGLSILMWIFMIVSDILSEKDEEEIFSKHILNDITKTKEKKISNKIIATYGIVSYVLSVILSATDLEGNLKYPIALLLLSGTLNLIFVIMATIRLWNIERILSLLFLSFYIILATLSVLTEIIVPTYGSFLVILTNIVKVIRLILFVLVIIKLFKTNSKNSDLEPFFYQ